MTIGFFVLLALLLGWRTLLWRPRPLPGVTRPRPWLIGHRGLRGRLPENSVAAFRAAFAAGLDGIETDVQRSRDGALVLFHDEEIAGRRVTDLSLAQLRELEPSLATLDELFDVARDEPGTLLNLEIKSSRWRTRGLERAVIEAVRASGLAPRVLISSFDPRSLLRVRLLAPELRIGLLYAAEMPPLLRSGWLAGWLHADAIHPEQRLVTPALVAAARRRGLQVNSWTVNDPERVKQLLAWGVDGIMADDPEALLRAAGRATGGPGSAATDEAPER